MELPPEIGLVKARAFTARRRQAGVLHESGQALLPELVLAGFPGRLGIRLASTGRDVPLVEFGGRAEEVSRRRGRSLRDGLLRVILLRAVQQQAYHAVQV